MKDKCIYPNWEGGYEVGEHIFGQDGDCIICGKTKEVEIIKQDNGTN